VKDLRGQGIKAGLFRPITLWPFPIDQLVSLRKQARGFVIVEAGSGQLEDELRLAMSHAGVALPRIARVRRMGGVLPSKQEIIDRILALEEVPHGNGVL
jgi:pyruvate/2-oxoacid:ferredoxin oxidoreductase alpha subunit